MRALLAAWLLFLSSALHGQVDSLLHVLPTLPQDTSRLTTLTEIIKELVFTDPDSALVFVGEFTVLAERGGTTLHKAKAHNLAGMCYSVKSDYGTALPHYQAALDGFEKAGDNWYVAMLHNNIGSVHKEENRLDMAEREITAALRGFTELQDTLWTAIMLNNLANIFRARELPDSAAAYYDRAVKLLVGINAAEHAASIRYNQGTIEGDRGRHHEAIPLYRDALRILGDRPEDHLRSMVLTEIGLSSLEIGELEECRMPLLDALAITIAGGFKKQRASVHRALAEYYERIGHLDSALAQQRAFTQWNDSVYSEEKSAQINELQEKYDSGKKDVLLAENKAQLERRSIIIMAIGAGALMLLLAALFAFRAYRLKRRGEAELAKKNAIIESQLKEKELLVREIHHRVKNNLQTVSSLLSIQGRGITDEKAKEAVNDSRLRVKSMALIHQDLYREGDITGVRMKEYVEKLVTSLVTSYALGERVRTVVEVEDIALDVDTAVPIGLILNELVTNALKYAWPDERTGVLAVKLEREAESLFMHVADDGVGSDTLADESSTGFGLNMVKTFASKLKAEWEIEQDDEGTAVGLSIRNFKLAH